MDADEGRINLTVSRHSCALSEVHGERCLKWFLRKRKQINDQELHECKHTFEDVCVCVCV